eukprot:262-Lingulodinium_polyedra.AAC.1
MVSASDLVPMKEVLVLLPPTRVPRPQQPSAVASSSTRAVDKVVEQHPFLKGFLQREEELANPKGTSSSAADEAMASDDEEGEQVTLNDDQVQDAFTALEAKRE